MRSLARRRADRAARIVAALVLTLCGADDRVQGQVPPPSAGALGKAESLIQARSFDLAADLLQEILTADPGNRRAKDLLAFVLESRGDLEAECRLRASLAADYPDDPEAQAAYGRVLDRSGRTDEALAAYRRARALRATLPDADLDAAIERARGRSAVEIGTPIVTLTDPDASAGRAQAGAAVPFGSLGHIALVAARASAESRQGSGAATTDLVAASLVVRHPSGASLMVGPRLSAVSLRNGARDAAIGGVIAGQGALGRHFSADLSGMIDVPWEEAAVAMLHGGRTSAAEAHLYTHLWDRRLLLQVGAQERRLSILAPDPGAVGAGASGRAEASQSLRLAGADLVLLRKPVAARGELLDDGMVAPRALPTAIVAGYRHYEICTRTTPEFADVIDLAPRGSVDEISATISVASPRGRFGLELRGGLGRDAERDARLTRTGASLVWAPAPMVRFSLGYDKASDLTTGLTGRRHAGSFSLHVDL